MHTRILPLLLLSATCAFANTLYKCTDASGQVLYTNQKSGGKSCTVLSQDQPVSSFTPPPRSASKPTPGDFPRVGEDQQKNRDNDRRAILNQELTTEQKNLDEARKQLAEQQEKVLPQERISGSINQAKVDERVVPFRDKVALHERNIEALKKELANLK